VRTLLQFTLCVSALVGVLAGCSSKRCRVGTPTRQPEPTVTPSAISPAATKTKPSIALPETDEGLPGAGPIRRAQWFQQVWIERKTYWLNRTDADQRAIVFLGDSITQLWGDDFGGSFPGLHVANRGISGDTSRGVLIRVNEDVIALHPKAVVLLIGTNDIEENTEPRVIAGNVELLVQTLEKALPRIVILLCEVFPSSASKHRPAATIRELNGFYGALAARDRSITLVHTWSIYANADGDAKPSEFPDLLHPNAAGYAKWAQVLRPEFAKLAASASGR
jgi:lysophospholipase L1-like esterase